MTFEIALWATEIILAFAILQQGAEHVFTRRPGFTGERCLFAGRMALAALLFTGVAAPVALMCLAGLSLVQLRLFQGPYNGGSDRMGLLILWCLLAATLLPQRAWAELALGYLALQLTLSYFISGWVKITNRDWRSGRALADVFLFSAYPVAENMRALRHHPRLLQLASWGVMGLELAFPLALLSAPSLVVALALTAFFHLANAVLFGLNRFFWTWIAAYPALIWFQGRFVG